MNDTAIKVLDFWHKVEFFESVDLSELKSEAGIIAYKQDDLTGNPTCLPWINSKNVILAGSYSPNDIYDYKIFMGIFERNEISYLANIILGNAGKKWDEVYNDEGLTCSISLELEL